MLTNILRAGAMQNGLLSKASFTRTNEISSRSTCPTVNGLICSPIIDNALVGIPASAWLVTQLIFC